jgi:hypothetical protein
MSQTRSLYARRSLGFSTSFNRGGPVVRRSITASQGAGWVPIRRSRPGALERATAGLSDEVHDSVGEVRLAQDDPEVVVVDDLFDDLELARPPERRVLGQWNTVDIPATDRKEIVRASIERVTVTMPANAENASRRTPKQLTTFDKWSRACVQFVKENIAHGSMVFCTSNNNFRQIRGVKLELEIRVDTSVASS